MIIIVDNREQLPYYFKRLGGTVVFDTLETGDYSIERFRKLVAVERKSIGDFYLSIGKERDRFFAEMERLSAYQFKMLVVEADFSHALDTQSNRFTKLKPSNVWASVNQLTADYGIPVMFAGARANAEESVYRFLERSYELLTRYGNIQITNHVRWFEICSICGMTRSEFKRERPDIALRDWIRIAHKTTDDRAHYIGVCRTCRDKIAAKKLCMPEGYKWSKA